MGPAAPEEWIRLRPQLPASASATIFQRCASAVARTQRRLADDPDRALSNMLPKSLAMVKSAAVRDRAALDAAVRVLLDLARQRWHVRVRKNVVEVSPPLEFQSNPGAEKARVRRQELIKRDEQLAQPSVRRFIQDMERQRLHAGRFVSIFSLMRDGRELAAGLRAARRLPDEQRATALRSVVDPYLQF